MENSSLYSQPLCYNPSREECLIRLRQQIGGAIAFWWSPGLQVSHVLHYRQSQHKWMVKLTIH